VVSRCAGPDMCPHLVRERLLLPALEGYAPRLVGDVAEGGRWAGFVREYVEGVEASRLLVDMVSGGRLRDAARAVEQVGRLLASIHSAAGCVSHLFPFHVGGLEWARSVAAWAAALGARGWRREAGLLAGLVEGVWPSSRSPVVPHGDPHLGQFIVSGGRVVVIDLRGEPLRGPRWLFARLPPERDLAAALRSIDYVVVMAGARRWGAEYRALCRGLLRGYLEASGRRVDRDALMLWVAERAGYEAFYEYAAGTGLEWVPVSALAAFSSRVWDCGG